MAIIDNLAALQRKLADLKKKVEQQERSVQVGYTQKYAIYVHEMTGLEHAEGKQAKYLEGPFRNMRGELIQIVQRTYEQTGRLDQGLVMAGLRLQRASQEVVPIDTGALKASAFTAFDEEANSAAAKAFTESEALRANRSPRNRQ